MGQVTVTFLGVCTIFRNFPRLVPPGVLPPGTAVPANRVVLARTTEELISRTGIKPHIAKVKIEGDIEPPGGVTLPPFDSEPQTYRLDGVGLQILNATNVTLSSPRGLDCLPSMAANLNQQLEPPAPWVFVEDPANVQSWFDIQGGEWQAYLMSTIPPCATVPSISIVTMETDGDPILQYTVWGGTGPRTVTLTRQLGGVPWPPNVIVSNFAEGQGVIDDNRDFILNYTLTLPFPDIANIQIPRANVCSLPSPRPFILPRCGDAGPGCSSTTYP